jgi:hypothetical protein
VDADVVLVNDKRLELRPKQIRLGPDAQQYCGFGLQVVLSRYCIGELNRTAAR